MPTTTTAIEQLADQFQDEGFVIIHKLIEPQVLTSVCHELHQWVDRQSRQLMDKGLITDPLADAPFETRLARLYENCLDHAPNSIREELHWPGMFGLFFHRGLLDIVEAILGPEIRLYPNYTVRPKLPDHAATQVLWHQDAGYTATGRHGHDSDAQEMSVTQLQMVNVWAPLVPARPENGCMKFIPRSHKLGLVDHTMKQFYLEIIESQLKPRLNDALDVMLDPGDVVLFSNLLFHMGQPNTTKTVRWSCDWRYQIATQSTMRQHVGHIARSRSNPDSQVKSAEQWASLSFI